MNPLAATFEFADYQAKAQDEIDRGVSDGPYLTSLYRLVRRARVWEEASAGEREAAVAAFDGAHGEEV
ncbi:hypothetical protein OBBRIDRAFT_408341 [Obba rivulosa]|uniref:Uncharacterized protein n=1 Tax=Obba rivulosa TaxID=1052685 RepID=A0A8E2AM04_9APHY|nr:hypothetical protein OBBRIDRAFT_408341 [Obba rivulosa]